MGGADVLTFGIRYLNGFVAASESDHRERVEWPPHPARIFMALAAAHFQTGGDPEERRALLWLESLEEGGEPAAPHIAASRAWQRSVRSHYVPVNDSNVGVKKGRQTVVYPEIGQTGLRRNRQERTFARAWLDDDKVYLTWPGFEPGASTRAALERLCNKVTRIGHSTSLVHMWLAQMDEPAEATWIPDDIAAELYLRVAPSGTLEYLERQFNGKAIAEFADLQMAEANAVDEKARRASRKRLREDFPDGQPGRLRPSVSVYRGYAPSHRMENETTVTGTVFSPHLIVFSLTRVSGSQRQLDLACTLAVASRWREAILSQSGGYTESVRSVLSGHDPEGLPLEGPHLGLAPLAFVGHEHADGHLLGLGAILPADVGRDDRRQVLRAIGSVHELRIGRLGVWRLETLIEDRPARNLRAQAWTAPPSGALQWSTVTPVAFDRHPKVKGQSAYRSAVAEMIERSCAHIGLPVPRQVVVTPVSAHLGVPASHAFPRLQRKDGTQRQHTHAILVFDKPVRGPILLGAGRYRGYGFCRPLDGFDDGRADQ